MDTFSKKDRSRIMANISGASTKPEILVRKFLFANGFRFRINVKKLPGKPDIVLPKYKTIIMVHGCFWHGHDKCEAAKLPKSNLEYWGNKISRNMERDKQTIFSLLSLNWKVIVIWECELKNTAIRHQRLIGLLRQISESKIFKS